MQVNLRLSNAYVLDVNRVDVREGEIFSLSLTDTHNEDNLEWFTNNDPVLSIEVSGQDAEVSAENVGSTKILIMSAGQTLKTLEINVVEEILPMAVTLGLTAGSPEPKATLKAS